MNKRPRFSIFIPTYNRAHLLPRALESISAQHFDDLEVLIIDDGSTDNTAEVVAKWREKQPFDVVYHRQANQGKQAAYNTAIEMAKGELFVNVDSDDMLAEQALSGMLQRWQEIPDAERNNYACIRGMCAFTDGRLSGKPVPEPPLDVPLPIMARQIKLGGERKGFYNTDAIREYRHKVFPGERYVRGSIIEWQWSDHLLTRYLNDVWQILEYQAGGLTRQGWQVRMRNPQGFRYWHHVIMALLPRFGMDDQWYKEYVNFIRYSVHCGVPLATQRREVPSKLRWLLALPRGLLHVFGDKRRMRKRGLS